MTILDCPGIRFICPFVLLIVSTSCNPKTFVPYELYAPAEMERVQAEEQIKKHIEELSSENEQVRAQAASKILSFGKKAQPLLLSSIYQNKNPLQCMLVIKQMNDPQILPQLRTLLYEVDNQQVKCEIIEVFVQFNDRIIIPDIVYLYSTPQTDFTLKSKILWAIGMMQDERGLSLLVASLKEECEPLRHQAIMSLGQFKDEKINQILLQHYKLMPRYLDYEEKCLIIKILGKRRSLQAMELLTEELLQSASTFVRIEAARALGQLRQKQSCPALFSALNDHSNDVVIASHEALCKIYNIQSQIDKLDAQTREKLRRFWQEVIKN